MKLRYELVDKQHALERGQRFSTLDQARRELAHAVPQSRFYIEDRTTGMEVSWAARQDNLAATFEVTDETE